MYLLFQVPGVLPPAAAIPGLAGLGAAGLGLGLGAGLGASAIDPLSMAAAGMSAIGGLGALAGGAAGEHVGERGGKKHTYLVEGVSRGQEGGAGCWSGCSS